jgi:hypothetical protein
MRVNYWDHVAVSFDEHEIREAILAGYAQGKPFEPDALRVRFPPGLHSIIDWGCGLGRNWPLLRQHARTIYAYDRCAMLVRAMRQPIPDDVIPTQFIHTLQPVDMVFMSLVLQHVERADIVDVWRNLPRHRFLLVHGRARHDEGGATFDMIPTSVYRAAWGYRCGSTRDINATSLWTDARADQSEDHFEFLFERRTDTDI